jgi:hypothetical protein
VISDCRFPNEIQALRAAGGVIVCVERGVQPHWTAIAAKANNGDTKAQAWLRKENIHASETSWVGTDFDFVLYNNASIDSLYTQIQDIINQAPRSPGCQGKSDFLISTVQFKHIVFRLLTLVLCKLPST